MGKGVGRWLLEGDEEVGGGGESREGVDRGRGCGCGGGRGLVVGEGLVEGRERGKKTQSGFWII